MGWRRIAAVGSICVSQASDELVSAENVFFDIYSTDASKLFLRLSSFELYT